MKIILKISSKIYQLRKDLQILKKVSKTQRLKYLLIKKELKKLNHKRKLK